MLFEIGRKDKIMSELLLTVGGNRATRPLSDFLTIYNAGGGPKAGVYFVDLNVAASGDGSADHPFSTLAEAITASNASIGLAANRWWARRNRIFVCGDGIEEDLTVLPEKCDIIGCGSDLVPYPRIIGAHTIAVAKVGCRFINMGFTATGTGDLFVIPAGCHGLRFIGGHMQPSAAGNTKALEITDSALVRIEGVEIYQNPGAYGTGIFGVGIAIEGTASNHQTVIKDCYINATEGIDVVESAPAYDSRVEGCVIHAVGLTIDDNSDQFHVINNRLITDIDTSTSTAGYDFNVKLASGNLLTGSQAGGACDTVPFTLIAE
jgi:predicted small secreted protein